MRCLLFLALAALVAGCGNRSSHESKPLVFEELDDTSSLSKGEPLLTKIEPYRMDNGALRIRGLVDFPDGTRIQITITDKDRRQQVGSWQMTVQDHRFDSPPILGPQGPLPARRYRLEYLAHFNEAWQPKSVLLATDNGRNLRGPGVTRSRQGLGAFFLAEERRL